MEEIRYLCQSSTFEGRQERLRKLSEEELHEKVTALRETREDTKQVLFKQQELQHMACTMQKIRMAGVMLAECKGCHGRRIEAPQGLQGWCERQRRIADRRQMRAPEALRCSAQRHAHPQAQQRCAHRRTKRLKHSASSQVRTPVLAWQPFTIEMMVSVRCQCN